MEDEKALIKILEIPQENTNEIHKQKLEIPRENFDFSEDIPEFRKEINACGKQLIIQINFFHHQIGLLKKPMVFKKSLKIRKSI